MGFLEMNILQFLYYYIFQLLRSSSDSFCFDPITYLKILTGWWYAISRITYNNIVIILLVDIVSHYGIWYPYLNESLLRWYQRETVTGCHQKWQLIFYCYGQVKFQMQQPSWQVPFDQSQRNICYISYGQVKNNIGLVLV